MKKKRLIPVLLLKDGFLVQSNGFSKYRNLGNPITALKRLNDWSPDEIIYLDISKSSNYDLRRDDTNCNNRHDLFEILEDVSKVCFAPITMGGRIRTLEDMEKRLKKGADKISINTAALERPKLIQEAAAEFGSQCVIASVDVKKIGLDYKVMSHCGQSETKYKVIDWVLKTQDLGVGEILLNSIDRDGQKNGFDIELISSVSDAVNVPVIALGGAGEIEHFSDVLLKTRADGIAAANYFQHVEQSIYLVKKQLFQEKHNVRAPYI